MVLASVMNASASASSAAFSSGSPLRMTTDGEVKNVKELTALAAGLLLLVTLALIVVSTVIIMVLWNWLMPIIFTGIPPITFWQALGLKVLLDFLLL